MSDGGKRRKSPPKLPRRGRRRPQRSEEEMSQEVSSTTAGDDDDDGGGASQASNAPQNLPATILSEILHNWAIYPPPGGQNPQRVVDSTQPISSSSTQNLGQYPQSTFEPQAQASSSDYAILYPVVHFEQYAPNQSAPERQRIEAHRMGEEQPYSLPQSSSSIPVIDLTQHDVQHQTDRQLFSPPADVLEVTIRRMLSTPEPVPRPPEEREREQPAVRGRGRARGRASTIAKPTDDKQKK